MSINKAIYVVIDPDATGREAVGKVFLSYGKAIKHVIDDYFMTSGTSFYSGRSAEELERMATQLIVTREAE